MFVSLEFNLVLVAAFTLAIRNTFISCLVDMVAGIFLLYATLVRNQILHENKWISDICSAINADETAVYHFLVHCLVSWVASVIIEFKSCKILSQLSCYGAWRLPKAKGQLVIFVLSAIVTLNGCWMMLHFTSAVYMSFEKLTSDPWLLMYYLLAAAAKNCGVLLQGMSHIVTDFRSTKT